jgi:hypothetical protein
MLATRDQDNILLGLKQLRADNAAYATSAKDNKSHIDSLVT